MPSLLWIGIPLRDPNFPLPPRADPKAVNDKIDAAAKAMEDAGYKVNVLNPHIKEGVSLVQKELQATKYDAILVGVSFSVAFSIFSKPAAVWTLVPSLTNVGYRAASE